MPSKCLASIADYMLVSFTDIKILGGIVFEVKQLAFVLDMCNLKCHGLYYPCGLVKVIPSTKG